jgi:hypothetical protein
MSMHTVIISSILAAVLLTFTIEAALADFDWNTGTGSTWGHRSTDTLPLDRIIKLETGKTLQWRISRTDFGDLFYLRGVTTGTAGERIYSRSIIGSKPMPPAIWLLSSGIVGLIGIRRRNQKRA